MYVCMRRWWSGETAAVVTGANHEIDFEIALQLAVHGLRVVLAARDTERGRAAAERLREEEGLCVEPRHLDVTDLASVDAFANWVSAEYGRIDILVRFFSLDFVLFRMVAFLRIRLFSFGFVLLFAQNTIARNAKSFANQRVLQICSGFTMHKAEQQLIPIFHNYTMQAQLFFEATMIS